jgi:hypothetical protein
MKRFASTLLLAGCLLAIEGVPGAFAAEAAPPSVSVEGVANVPISQTADQASADAVYRQGLTAAIADGLEKATFFATATGAKVGSIEQIVEQGGSIECDLPAEAGTDKEYEPYNGLQPDFGSVPLAGTAAGYAAPAAPEVAVSRPKIVTKKSKKHKRKHKATAKKAAEAVHCTLSAQVVLSYLLITPTT